MHPLAADAADYLEGLLEGFVAYDAQWRLVYVNAAGERLLGRDRDDLLGKTWHEAFPHAVGNVLDEMYHRVMRTRVAERMELFYPHYGRWMEISAAPARSGGIGVYFRDATERNATEAALRESERQLRMVTDHAPVLIVYCDAAYRYRFVNAPYAERFGLRREEVVGRHIAEVVGGEVFERLRPRIDEALAGTPVEFEEELPYPQGIGARRMHCAYVPERAADGAIAGFVGVIHDVTARHAAAAALHESEERLTLALQAGRMGSWEWHVAEQRVVWSPALEALHGLAPGTFPGTFEAYQRDVHPEDRERVQRAIAGSLQGDGTHQIEYRIVRPDGSVRWVEGRGRVLRDARGKVERLVGVCADITERKRAEEALREAAEFNRRIVESSSDCIKILSRDGLLLAMSENSQRQLCIPDLAPYLNRSWFDFWQGEDRDAAQSAVQAAAAGGRGSFVGFFRTLDGADHWWDVSITPMLGADGRPEKLLAVSRDITERKNAEEALREADRRKDEFLATLSHELRNPLAPLRNALQFLALSTRGDARLEPLRELMERQVNHLVRLVDDLLEMSRISRGTLELRRERVELAAVVRNALETSQPLIRAARHQLSVSLPEEALWLDGDPVRLAQILANLLNNAAKYTPPGGRISLAAQARERAVEIAVRDNGAGIAPEVLPRLFEMFSRGAASGGAQEGLGIGLALARRLAEMHGGTLTAKSEGAGRGAEFTLALPLADADATGAAPSAPAERTARLAPRRILVVDDNRDAAQSLGMVLQLLGADVQVAHDGRQALAAFAAYEPAVIFLDIGMPDMNGYEVARRMRESCRARPPTLIALTGWGQEADRQRAREAGFDHHLVKPADMGALQALLASLEAGPGVH